MKNKIADYVKTCKHCNADLSQQQSRTKPRIFCNNGICSNEWYRNQQPMKKCLGCDMEFRPRAYRQTEQKFHSNPCSTKHYGKLRATKGSGKYP